MRPLFSSSSQTTIQHRAQDLISIFNCCFSESYNTILVGGANEPVYQPAQYDQQHQIVFSRDYFASALHEVSHWCIAGEARRELLDYGYWYSPDGRDHQQQIQFEQVEIKPQALEMAFSKACNKSFRVSIDNLDGASANEEGFAKAVAQQCANYTQSGFPERAAIFMDALTQHYGVNKLVDKSSSPVSNA